MRDLGAPSGAPFVVQASITARHRAGKVGCAIRKRRVPLIDDLLEQRRVMADSRAYVVPRGLSPGADLPILTPADPGYGTVAKLLHANTLAEQHLVGRYNDVLRQVQA